jgi:hypothetical protein
MTARPRISTPTRCSFPIESAGDDLELRRWMGSGSLTGAGFLLEFFIGRTAGCVSIAGLVARQPTLGPILFAIPSWTAWVVS